MTTELHLAVFDHGAIKDIAFSDKVSHEAVLWFVVYVGRGTYLLNFAFIHHHYAVTKRERFFLVVCDIDEGDAEFLMQLFEFDLHVVSHLKVKR